MNYILTRIKLKRFTGARLEKQAKISCRCRVKFSTQSDQPCRNLSHLYFWLIRSFTDPAFTCSILVVRFLADCLLKYLDILQKYRDIEKSVG